MSTRQRNRRERRAAAKQLTASDADITAVIVKPPEPAHDHWYHAGERRWYRHDQRVLDYIRLLRECDDDELLDEISRRIADGLSIVEP